jgi:hypothetical protein
LQEQVQSFVEGALRQSGPGQAFTASVLAMLPAVQLGSVIAGTSALGSAAGKTTWLGLLTVLKGALIKFVPGLAATYVVTRKLPESSRERSFLWKTYAGLWAMAVLFPVALYACGYIGSRYWSAHPPAFTWLILVSAFGFVTILGPFSFWIARKQRQIQKEEATRSGRAVSMSQPYEYRSRWTFLGIPLVHVCFNLKRNGRKVPAVGWIAIGEIAFGLVAMGGVAVGGITMGALGIGLVGLGGFGFGGFAFGGFAMGVIAMGGAAVGYMAYGGGAIAWLAASGGAVLAHHYATGGGAIAPHANDAAAYAFMNSNWFFAHKTILFDVLILLSWILPPTNMLIFRWRRERAAKAQNKPKGQIA